VQDKLIHRGRGGYCFEQNGLFLDVLRTLGFDVTPLSARVRLGRERSATPPRTHLCLRVDLDGEVLLVDVGVGAMSVTRSLRLVFDEPQRTPHETRRFVRDGSWGPDFQRGPDARIFHQALQGDDWIDVCDFTLEAMPFIDRELANWYTSAHPASHFRDRLLVARATPTGRVTLVNRTLKVRGLDGKSVVRDLAGVDEIVQVLRQEFGIVLGPEAPVERLVVG